MGSEFVENKVADGLGVPASASASVPTPVTRFHVAEIQVNPVGCDPEGILKQLADLQRKIANSPLKF